MKRRSFIAAVGTVLAAPLSFVFGKPAKRFPSWYPPIDPNGVSEWVNHTATYNEEPPDFAQSCLDGLEADQKAAGPWRIVEQTKDGMIVLERDPPYDEGIKSEIVFMTRPTVE